MLRCGCPQGASDDRQEQRPTAISKAQFLARALYVGERIDLRSFVKSSRVIAQLPATVAIDGGGMAVLYRYGAAVFFDVAPADQERFLARSARWSSSHTHSPKVKTFRSASVRTNGKGSKAARR